MRLSSLILVVFAAVGCKEPPPAKATDPKAAGSATPAARQPGEIPSLTRAFAADEPDNEPDRAWADATEKAVRAVAPELTDVTCRQQECRATLIAATEQELVAKAEQLQNEESLRNLDARGVVLSKAEQRDGKLAMTIYVKY